MLYIARDLYGAFAEAIGRGRQYPLVSLAELEERCFTEVTLSTPLRLVDCTGPGPARIGASGELSTSEHAITQRWSLALFNHPSRPDGLYYRAHYDLSRECAAIFGSAKPILLEGKKIKLADRSQAQTLSSILDTYGYGLD